MAYYSQWTTSPLDSGYSSSSTKKEKSGGLLGGLKNFFKGRKTAPRGEGRKKERRSMTLSDSQPDITDNYYNFRRNDEADSSFRVSPYELTPDAFINNPGLMRPGNELKPKKFSHALPVSKKPKEPEIPEFEIPIAGGPARRSVVGLFENPPPHVVSQKVEEGKNLSAGQTGNRSGISTPKESVHSHTVVKAHSHTSINSCSHSPRNQTHSITVETTADLSITVTHASNEAINSNGGDEKKLSPQCSDLSVCSEDPHTLYKQIHQQDSSRALERRGSLPNSIVSDISFKSERSLERSKRRRSKPKRIGPLPKPKQDVPISLAPSPPAQGMHPYMMGDPHYMPPLGLPYIPYPLPNQATGNGKKRHTPHHHHHQMTEHHPEGIPLPFPPPHPMMYPMYGYGMFPPQMFPPVLEEEGGEASSQVEEVGRRAKAKVKRSETTEKKARRQKRNNPVESKPKEEKIIDKPDPEDEDPNSPKGFDNFDLY